MKLTNLEEVKGIQANLHAVFDSPQGKAVMLFLEAACGWYESVFDPVNRDIVMLNAGRREVVATIKTLLKHTPEEIVALVKTKEESNA